MQVARISISGGPLGALTDDTGPSLRRDRDAWAVVLSGDFPAERVATPVRQTCVPDAETQLAVLVAIMGEVIYPATRPTATDLGIEREPATNR